DTRSVQEGTTESAEREHAVRGGAGPTTTPERRTAQRRTAKREPRTAPEDGTQDPGLHNRGDTTQREPGRGERAEDGPERTGDSLKGPGQFEGGLQRERPPP